ncbi:hypothetical protein LCGC14_3035060, partial [marine sediment metagenome]
MMNKSFDVENKKFIDIQEKIEQILKKEFLYSTTTARLGNSLIRINYTDKNVEIESQKDNRITLLQEQDKKVYVQIMGVLDDAKVGQLWEELENFFSIGSINIIEDSINNSEEKLDESGESIDRSDESIEIIEFLPSKDELVGEIKNQLENKGFFLEPEEVKTFINNFIEKYERLPVSSEINSIVKGYILMIQEENKLKSQVTEPVIEEPHEESPSNSFENVILSNYEITGRRKCPNCGNEGLIREVDDKTRILMDYPKIYAKKRCCTKCGYEWHVE